MKIRDFLRRFIEKKPEFQLAEKPDTNTINAMLEDLLYNEAVEMVKRYPISNIEIMVTNYSVNRYYDDLLAINIRHKKESISIIKSSTISTDVLFEHNFRLSTSVFSIGLDNEVWRIDTEILMMYDCSYREFEVKKTDIGIGIINKIYDRFSLDKMFMYKTYLKKTLEYDSTKTLNIEGYSRTICDHDDLKYFGLSGILFERQVQEEFDDPIEDRSDEKMVVKVIRKKKSWIPPTITELDIGYILDKYGTHAEFKADDYKDKSMDEIIYENYIVPAISYINSTKG